MEAVLLAPFEMAATVVTNQDFALFVAESGYLTDAEHQGWSFVFHAHVAAKPEDVTQVDPRWWRRVRGANWRRPFGLESDTATYLDYPVTQVSYHDAKAFCTWHGLRLPSEVEWEHAARGGLLDPIYPWGNRQPNDTDFQPCNIWQGTFPEQDLAKDGYAGLAPARSFTANGFGLYNMSGNVWEWTSEPRADEIILKGGSHLCHASYCHRYRIAARMSNPAGMATSHIGFRVARNGPSGPKHNPHPPRR